MKNVALFMILSAAALWAQAQQPVYRCGQTYTHLPCPDGKLIDSTDPRSSAQRAEAKRAMARERQLAAQLEREREAREAAGSAFQAMSLGSSASVPSATAASAARPSKPRAKTRKAKAASGKDFVAVIPAKPAQK